MHIQEIEKRTGMERATIRYYEREGLINPLRLQNGYRDYSDENCSDLLKIKLLRQLGLTMEQITQIMHHEITLQSALNQQLDIIKNRQDLLTRSAVVCQMMKQDAVDFETVDPIKYLDKFATPMIQSCADNKELPKADVVREIHPIRRFLARRIDEFLWDALILFIVIVILRVRPFTPFVALLFTVTGIFATMVLNALSISLFATTPGKWLMGIRLEVFDGTKPNFKSMLRREWLVLKDAYGFFLPIYSFFKLLISYDTHKSGQELDWDFETNVDFTYKIIQVRDECITVVAVIVMLLLQAVSIYDVMFPTYRDDKLTVAQFAENYNDYAQLIGDSTFLSEEGEWYTETTGHVVYIDIFEISIDYLCDDAGYIESLEILVTASGDVTIPVIPEKMQTAILTAAMSQPGWNLKDRLDLLSSSTEDMLKSLQSGIRSGSYELDRIHCKWKAEITGESEFFLSMLALDSDDATYLFNLSIQYP